MAFGQSWGKGSTYQVSYNCFNILVAKQVYICLWYFATVRIDPLHPTKNAGRRRALLVSRYIKV